MMPDELLQQIARDLELRHAALLESVEARLTAQRQAIIAEYADAFREQHATIGTLEARIADLEDSNNELVSCVQSLQRRLTAAEERLGQASRALAWNNVRCQP